MPHNPRPDVKVLFVSSNRATSGRGRWLAFGATLVVSAAMLYAQSERYRHLSFALGRENRDVDAEHKAILDACLGRDPDLACRLIDDHLKRTTDILAASPPLRRRAATSSDAESIIAR